MGKGSGLGGPSTGDRWQRRGSPLSGLPLAPWTSGTGIQSGRTRCSVDALPPPASPSPPIPLVLRDDPYMHLNHLKIKHWEHPLTRDLNPEANRPYFDDFCYARAQAFLESRSDLGWGFDSWT